VVCLNGNFEWNWGLRGRERGDCIDGEMGVKGSLGKVCVGGYWQRFLTKACELLHYVMLEMMVFAEYRLGRLVICDVY